MDDWYEKRSRLFGWRTLVRTFTSNRTLVDSEHSGPNAQVLLMRVNLRTLLQRYLFFLQSVIHNNSWSFRLFDAEGSQQRPLFVLGTASTTWNCAQFGTSRLKTPPGFCRRTKSGKNDLISLNQSKRTAGSVCVIGSPSTEWWNPLKSHVAPPLLCLLAPRLERLAVRHGGKEVFRALKRK